MWNVFWQINEEFFSTIHISSLQILGQNQWKLLSYMIKPMGPPQLVNFELVIIGWRNIQSMICSFALLTYLGELLPLNSPWKTELVLACKFLVCSICVWLTSCTSKVTYILISVHYAQTGSMFRSIVLLVISLCLG